MAMSVVYTTVNGRILRENRGGVVHHFVSDPLGSVVMVRDNSGNTVYEAEYDPYGNVQSETGTNPSEFGYVGTLGYVKDSASSLYVRARYLLTNLGRWLSKDPLWPDEPGFVYAGAKPSGVADPFGLAPLHVNPPEPPLPKPGRGKPGNRCSGISARIEIRKFGPPTETSTWGQMTVTVPGETSMNIGGRIGVIDLGVTVGGQIGVSYSCDCFSVKCRIQWTERRWQSHASVFVLPWTLS